MKTAFVQTRIDAAAYPPTHTYELRALRPLALLAERFRLVSRLAPHFFVNDSQHRFLDVGCNKGFFSLYAAVRCGYNVVGIDSSSSMIDLCRDAVSAAWAWLHDLSMEFAWSGFRDYKITDTFDRVLLGNVHHYLFVEAGGWDWTSKLAALTRPGGQVVIEGPVNMTCPDMLGCIPSNLRDHFTERGFLAAMTRYFTLVRQGPSISYTPGREMWLFRRLEPVIIDDIEVVATVHDIAWPTLTEGASGTVVKLKPDRTVVAKLPRDFNAQTLLQAKIASLSPFATKVVGDVFEGRGQAGWLEKFAGGRFVRLDVSLAPKDERAVLRAVCEHEAFLLRLGYVDFDLGVLNWCINDDGSLTYVDKNSVWHVSELNDTWINKIVQTFLASYNELRYLSSKVQAIFELRDSCKMEQGFIELKELLK